MVRTNAFSILCVVIRTFAMWLFASTLLELPSLYITARRLAPENDIVTLSILTSGCLAVLALVLWVFADKIAKLALARPQQQVFDSDIAVFEWQALAFSIVGLWQVVSGSVYLGNRMVVLLHRHFEVAADGARADLSSDFVGWLVADCLRIAIGLALLFGARGLVGLIRRYREAGHAPAIAIEAIDADAPAAGADPAKRN